MDQPLVSVIIPVYNGSNYLREAIDSILAQTYPNIETIVINDGSTDNGQTEDIILSYGDKVRYIYKENGGVATALNMGIAQMKGEYFLWLSHDDVFYPDKVQKQVQLLQSEHIRMAACSYNIFYDSGRKISVPIVDFYGDEIIQNSVFSVLHGLIQFGGVMLKKEIFDEYGIFREELRASQDYEFLFRVLRKEKCVFSNKILYGIRYHKDQGSNTLDSVNVERIQEHEMFMNKLSRKEKKNLYGSVYNFYYQMLLRLWPFPNTDSLIQQCLKQLSNEKKQKDSAIVNFVQPILIYGAGLYGRRLLFDLRCRNVNVAGFIDGNRLLWGKEIDGVLCYSVKDVERGKVSGTIIVASIFREEIAENLKLGGIAKFYFKEQWDKEHLRTAPELYKIEEVVTRYGTFSKHGKG